MLEIVVLIVLGRLFALLDWLLALPRRTVQSLRSILFAVLP